MEFTEKNARHNGRTIVWVRKNGISFLTCEKLRRYYSLHDDNHGEFFEHDWRRPGAGHSDKYVACATTGEIIVAKRIRSRVVESVHLYVLFADVNKRFHPQIECLSMTRDTFNGWMNGDGMQTIREFIRNHGIEEAVYSWGGEGVGEDLDTEIERLRICHGQGHMRLEG